MFKNQASEVTVKSFAKTSERAKISNRAFQKLKGIAHSSLSGSPRQRSNYFDKMYEYCLFPWWTTIRFIGHPQRFFFVQNTTSIVSVGQRQHKMKRGRWTLKLLQVGSRLRKWFSSKHRTAYMKKEEWQQNQELRGHTVKSRRETGQE